MGIDTLEELPPEAKTEAQKMEEKKEESEIKIDHEKVLGMIKQVEGLFNKLKIENKPFSEDISNQKKWIREGNTEISYILAHGGDNFDEQKLITIDTYGEDKALENRVYIQAQINKEHPEKNMYIVELPNQNGRGYGKDIYISERRDSSYYNQLHTIKDEMESAKKLYEIPNSDNLTSPDQIQKAIFDGIDHKIKDSIGYIENKKLKG